MWIFLFILFCIYGIFGKTVFMAVLLILGIFITAGNWSLLINYYRKKQTGSSVPLFGGLFICIALWYFIPYPWHWFSLLGLFIDYGCLPLIFYTLFCIVTGKYKDAEITYNEEESDNRD